MSTLDYHTSFTASVTPAVAFETAAHPERWWNVMTTGDASTSGSRWVFDVPGLHHSEFIVTEADPGRRLVWHVVASGAADEADEWIGTDIAFDFRPDAVGTTITFTHHGLQPQLDCHKVCSAAWSHHLEVGLKALLVTGRGEPLTPATIAAVAAAVGALDAPPEGNVP